MSERDPLVTVTVILPCKDSSVMVMGKNLMMVDLEVELVYLIFYLHLVELFSSLMGRYAIQMYSIESYSLLSRIG